MTANIYDVLTLVAYFVLVMGVGIWKGRGKRNNTNEYFMAKGSLPWWVITAAFVTTGMNTEQLVGQNGMGYHIGLTMLNWYFVGIFVISLLVFFFLPIYLRSGIMTMPEYLGKRFDSRSQNVFTVVLLLSYVFLNLAVVFFGGAKLLEVVFGLNIWYGVLLLGVISGIYTMYGGMSSAAYAAVVQFALIFVSGFVLFGLAYAKLPNGWSDVVTHAPGGYHLMQPMNYPQIPWHAIPLTILGLHLYYSCVNQALVQRCLGARQEWDARMGLLIAGFIAVIRPFIEILPGMICRALGKIYPESGFNLDNEPVDNVFPAMINLLIPAGLRGLILVGILASVMSTIAAFLNSISTLFTMDVYKKWINKDADEKKLVRVGTIATFVLMIFSIVYSPFIEKLGGGIFNYFQTAASYLAVPIATVFLVGILWKRATATSALVVMIAGIPIGLGITALVGLLFSGQTIASYSLTNPFVISGVSQVVCVVLMVIISLFGQPKPAEATAPFVFSKKTFLLPADDPKRPFWQSIWVWWVIFILLYVTMYVIFW